MGPGCLQAGLHVWCAEPELGWYARSTTLPGQSTAKLAAVEAPGTATAPSPLNTVTRRTAQPWASDLLSQSVLILVTAVTGHQVLPTHSVTVVGFMSEIFSFNSTNLHF